MVCLWVAEFFQPLDHGHVICGPCWQYELRKDDESVDDRLHASLSLRPLFSLTHDNATHARLRQFAQEFQEASAMKLQSLSFSHTLSLSPLFLSSFSCSLS